MYEDGFEVKVDYKRAAELYTLPADQWDADEQCNLVLMYIKESRVERVDNRADE